MLCTGNRFPEKRRQIMPTIEKLCYGKMDFRDKEVRIHQINVVFSQFNTTTCKNFSI